MTFALDASIALSWYFSDEISAVRTGRSNNWPPRRHSYLQSGGSRFATRSS